MKKNYFVICVTMICLLVLVGCTSLKVGTEVLKNPTTESQGAAEIESQGKLESITTETQEIVTTEVKEQQETQKTTETEVQENQKPILVEPLPITVDLVNLDDCTLAISLDKGNVYIDKSGAAQMDVTVYVYDLYDMVDISRLKEGDTILLRQEEVVVSSVERKDNGAVLINGGLDVGGYELFTTGNTVYYERGYSDTKFYYELGKVTLPVSPEFIYNDASDLDKDAVIYHISDFLENSAEIAYYFKPNNTTITIQDGVVVEMSRIYTP